MLRERAKDIIASLRGNPSLIANTLNFTDSLAESKLTDPSIPITYCSGPIKQRIRAQTLERHLKRKEALVESLASKEQPVLALLKSLSALRGALEPPANLEESLAAAEGVLRKEEHFKQEREFCDFKIRVL